VEYEVEIAFTTAARGGKITINVPMTDDCATCAGTGSKPGSKPKPCPECSGSGIISFGKGGFAVNRPCPACLGHGEVPTDPCTVCGGSGQVRETRQILLAVPAGVDNGSKLRLSGQGEKGAGGAGAGDLLITFKVKPHHFFRRDGLDIHCTIPINFAQATLGSKVRVKTVDGKKVALRIPPGTQSGTRFRVAGQGIEKAGRRGDQYVQVKVQVPEQLSDDEQQRMREFAAAAGMKH
jgi:molecular chaperone DnaJ